MSKQKTIAKDIPLAEITLRRYEKPANLNERELVRKLCLSIGLLQPGDSRDVVVDVLNVLIKAIENASPKDETTTIEYGGARYPQAVDVSPYRRVNLALRWFVQGAYQKCFGKKTKMAESLAREIILASEGNMESYAMSKKNDAEKQADAAR